MLKDANIVDDNNEADNTDKIEKFFKQWGLKEALEKTNDTFNMDELLKIINNNNSD